MPVAPHFLLPGKSSHFATSRGALPDEQRRALCDPSRGRARQPLAAAGSFWPRGERGGREERARATPRPRPAGRVPVGAGRKAWAAARRRRARSRRRLPLGAPPPRGAAPRGGVARWVACWARSVSAGGARPAPRLAAVRRLARPTTSSGRVRACPRAACVRARERCQCYLVSGAPGRARAWPRAQGARLAQRPDDFARTIADAPAHVRLRARWMDVALMDG